MGSIKQEIERYLKKNRFGVLCVCSNNDPRATPVRYRPDGVMLNIFSEKYTAKFKVLEKNPSVSLGIYSARAPRQGASAVGKS